MSLSTINHGMRECGDCGVLWAMTDGFLDQRRNDHRTWYCPNGHSWHYPGESDLEKAKRQAKEARDSLARERARLDQVQASLRATKGVVTKQRTKLERVAKGVCPCCNRSFRDLKRHMTTKHPDYNGQPQ